MQVTTEGDAGIVYYVTAIGDDCPAVPNQEYCHSLYYYANLSNWTADNITLVFLPGEHRLNDSLRIEGVSSVTLRGSLVNDKHKIAIKCNAISITNVTTVTIENLIFSHPTCLFLENIKNLIICKTSVHFIMAENCSFLTIRQSVMAVNESRPIDTVSTVGTIHLTDITGGIILQDTYISGNTFSLSTKRSKCLQAVVLRNVIIKCLYSILQIDEGDDCPENRELNFNNVTASLSSSITASLSSSIELIHGGNIILTDVKVSNAVDFLIQSNGRKIYLNRVSVTNSISGLSIQKSNAQVTINNTLVTHATSSSGLFVGYCNNLILENVVVSHCNGVGLALEGVKGSINIINCTIAENGNTGLYVRGETQLAFKKHPSIIANNTTPGNGGGMWLSDQIQFSSDTKVYFINNVAKGVGGAIYSNMVVSNKRYHLKLCTLYNLNSQNMELSFQNNSGKLGGNDIYGGQYWDCFYEQMRGVGVVYSIIPEKSFKQAINCTTNAIFTTIPQKSLSSHITLDPIGVCMCTNHNKTNCTTRTIDRDIYPGQSINLSLATVGACEGLSPGELVTSSTSGVAVSLENSNQETSGKSCKTFTYKLQPNPSYYSRDVQKVFLRQKTYPGEKILSGSALTILVKFLPCPVGLELSAKKKLCLCISIIETINGTACSVGWMPHPIARSGNNWLSHNQEYSCTIAHKYCPFDYCNSSTVYFNLTHPDLQCTNGRSGTLCGRCQPGLSLMLGSNRCKSCNDEYLSLVIVFALAGLSLVAFLLVCNLTVSVGSINGLLFYANVIKLNEAVLFPNGVSIPVLSQFIAWLNLDFGIQTCFIKGLDGYWKTWLQFLFPVYIWLLISVIIIACHYSGRLTRLFGNNSVPVLATLILMSYNKLLRIITNALMFAVIKCEPDRQWSVWSIDGNIDYLSSKHIPLFLIAIVLLAIGLVYTGLVFSIQWLQYYCGKCCKRSSHLVIKLKPFLDAYTGPYKDKCRYWTGLLLTVRLLLTGIFSGTTGTMPQINNYIIAFMSGALLFISRGVYRRKSINLLEYFYLFNLGALSLLNSLSDHIGFGYKATIMLTVISVSLSLLAFIITVLAHVFRKKCSCSRKNKERECIPLHKDDSTNGDEEMYSPANFIISRREPLIFDFQS